MKIAAKYIEIIKGSKEIKIKLMSLMNISLSTLRRYLMPGNTELTKAENLEILSKVLNVPVSKLLVKGEVKKAQLK